MAITNNYKGFNLKQTANPDQRNADNSFGQNRNRDIPDIQSGSAKISNPYHSLYNNQFGSTARFSGNEQMLVDSMVKENIKHNGITVRYMPRTSEFDNGIWNEAPESRFDRGYTIASYLVSAAGFEGEQDILTTYGLEIREEVNLSISISDFAERHEDYIAAGDSEVVARNRPLEGDLVVIPFGISSTNPNQYYPKFFEITHVQTFRDGGLFQLGDNFQYRIQARLFELSGEDLGFSPVLEGQDSEMGIIHDANDSEFYGMLIDSDDNVMVFRDSDQLDPYADNQDLEEAAQHADDSGNPLLVLDYTARAFGYQNGIINDLDDI